MELNKEALLGRYTERKTNLNQRQYYLKMFKDRLNIERGEFKPISSQRIGFLMSYIKTGDLLDFYKKCESAKSFSACWWAHIKPKI